MKIDEIKKGVEYALTVDRHIDPRRVKAIKVVTVPERIWNGKMERYDLRNVRRIQVQFLDTPRDRWDDKKGSKRNVPARDLIAGWVEIGPNLRARVEEDNAKRVLTAETEKRMKKLLGRSYDGYVHAMNSNRFSLRVDDKSAVKLLELAEKGAGISGS